MCSTNMLNILITIAMLNIMTDYSLFEFQKSNEIDSWQIVNDGVMGGLSQSKISWDEKENTLGFSGKVSLENNGGFASVRASLPNFEQREFKKLKLRVRGDGNTYQFRMKGSENSDGIAYSLDFETEKDKWMEIELAVEDFEPTFRGRVYPEYGNFDSKDLKQIGILIAGKQEGKFHFEIDWIRTM